MLHYPVLPLDLVTPDSVQLHSTQLRPVGQTSASANSPARAPRLARTTFILALLAWRVNRTLCISVESDSKRGRLLLAFAALRPAPQMPSRWSSIQTASWARSIPHV